MDKSVETPQIQEEWMHLEYLGFTPAVIDETLETENSAEILRQRTQIILNRFMRQ